LLPTGQAVIQISLVPKHPKLEVASARRKNVIRMPLPRPQAQRIPSAIPAMPFHNTAQRYDTPRR